MRAFSFMAAVSLPSTRTVPRVQVSTQPIRFSAVDLPLPDGPAMAVNSPRPMRRLMPLSACTVVCPRG